MGLKINKLSNANVYLEGDSLLGQVKEIELPEVVQKMVDHEALGMVGVIELPAGFEKMEGKIMWNSFYKDAFLKIADATAVHKMQLRGNLETNTSDGLESEVAYVVYLNVRFKKTPMGNFKQHENVEMESEFSALSMKIEVDGTEILEFDPTANIYRVNGEDKLSTYRQNIGG